MRILKQIKLMKILILWLILSIFWIILTGSLTLNNLLIGLILSYFVSLFSYPIFLNQFENTPKQILPRLDLLLLILIILFVRMFLSSIDIIIGIVKNDFNPKIVRIRTSLQTGNGLVMLANFITLTPGTLTIDIHQHYLYIHWIKCHTEHSIKAGDLIKGNFEYLIKRIFE